MTLEDYLRAQPAIDHALRASIALDGTVTFYIHPMNDNGDTVDYEVHGNTLVLDPRITRLTT